ncbi:hypothetical protein [Thermomonospora umbrina]|uniref:Uncharacterized protein n=1 Tax=Thermomonospora umbrina TaxID=111806 RepID=A0A3D9SR06_9ACTN|nr:hypothetical protein [Thermomonospora umbrina]REE98369.1 hypothetical protein DFJ69_3856 [Thermomonospora umbrina]
MSNQGPVRSGGMSNGARHALGGVVGLILTPVIGGLLVFGVERLSRVVIRAEFSDRWIAAAALTAAAIAVGALAGSRVSPLGSAIPGALLALVNLPWLLSPRWSFENLAHRGGDLGRGYEIASAYGLLGIVGVALLVASLPPSRWRSTAPSGAPPRPPYAPPPPPPHAPQNAPGGQWGSHQPPGRQPGGSPAPPPYDPGPPPPGAGRPPQGEAVPGQIGGPPAPGPGPQQPHGPGHGSGPGTGGPDDEEPGEWTRMYGGNRGPQGGPPQG